MTNNKLPIIGINAFFLIAQIILMLGLTEKGYLNYVRSVTVTTGFWLLYLFLEAKYGLYMHNYVRVAMVLTLLSDGFFGYYLNLYATSVIFDKILHIFGTYAFSLFAYVLTVQLLTHPVKRSFKYILVFCLGLSMGAFYEVLEFLTDAISQPVPPSQPSLLDTDLDLISDIIGANLSATHAISRTFINESF